MTTPKNNRYAAIEAPLTFLTLRASLVSQRRLADKIRIPDASVLEIDQLLEETEDATRTLLLRTPLPDDEYLDAIFDDEFLSLCNIMGVNVLAWVNQPQILVRLHDADRLLSRWVAIAGEDGETPDEISTASYSESVAETKEAIHVLFAILKNSGSI
jgi:hypothetical protein